MPDANQYSLKPNTDGVYDLDNLADLLAKDHLCAIEFRVWLLHFMDENVGNSGLVSIDELDDAWKPLHKDKKEGHVKALDVAIKESKDIKEKANDL